MENKDSQIFTLKSSPGLFFFSLAIHTAMHCVFMVHSRFLVRASMKWPQRKGIPMFILRVEVKILFQSLNFAFLLNRQCMVIEVEHVGTFRVVQAKTNC